MAESIAAAVRRAFTRPATLAAVASFAVTAFILLIFCVLNGVAPFGDNSLAVMDGEVQDLDFFAFYKDVLAGKNSIDYTFSSYLGESAISTFAYFLASPFSLLVVFFDKPDLPACFDIIVILKLSLAAALMGFFLAQRFGIDLRKLPLCAVLGVAYGLSQYELTQASNILWLDGVYLLPILMLGAFRIVRERSMVTYSVACALALIFNWYLGAIAVLFSAVWACAEMLLYQVDLDGITLKERWSIFWKGVVCYLGALCIGVLMSCILFLPMLQGMSGTTRGNLQFAMLKNISFTQNLPNLIQNYTLGGTSSRTTCALYCGTFAMGGVLGAIFASKAPKKKRVAFAVILFVLAMLICWTPFYALFSLLKQVDSYWIRYSFVVIAGLIAIAGWYLLSDESGFGDKRYGGKLALAIVIFMALQLLLSYAVPSGGSGDRLATFFIELAFLALFACHAYGNRLVGRVALGALLVLSLGDIWMNTTKLLGVAANADRFKTYAEEAQTAVDAVKESDKTVYRMDQTSKRCGENEALAYNYMSTAGYASIAPARQINFLTRLGYPSNPIYDSHPMVIIPADSLNSVKYLFSARQEEGLTVRDDLPQIETKKVYENPYVLPIAYTIPSFSAASTTASTDPFTVMNYAYMHITGMFENIYSEVPYEQVDETLSDGTVKSTYTLTKPSDSTILYGDLYPGSGVLEIGDWWKGTCGDWIIYQVFPIPTDDDSKTAKVSFTYSPSKASFAPKFYALDLAKLQSYTSMVKAGAAKVIEFENGYAEFEVPSGSNKNLLVGIPIDDGWEVTVNGEPVDCDSFLDCYYEIPLQSGKNTVVMKYHGPNFLAGGALTLLGIALLVAYRYWKKERKS